MCGSTEQHSAIAVAAEGHALRCPPKVGNDVEHVQGNFRALKEVIQRELGGAGTVDGILLDLGMSSMQVHPCPGQQGISC